MLWIEETSVYQHWSKKISCNEWAYECINNDNDYQKQFIQKVVNRIDAKNENRRYEETAAKHGKGILLLRIDDPCFRWQRDLEKIIDQDHYKNVELGCFGSIYLYARRLIIHQKSSNPLVWESKVLSPTQTDFFLLCGTDLLEM